jgi:UDP-N-acetylmuramate: L-alanyl-gamma-D-glutamyl-meso-diaminopimelate ligase
MHERLARSLAGADVVHCYAKDLGWDPGHALAPLGARAQTHRDLEAMLAAIIPTLRRGDHVLVMSNGGFGGIHQKLLDRLASAAP